jgi:hypothetical protein
MSALVVHVSPPQGTWLRLGVVAAATGVPESTLRDAVTSGGLGAIRCLGSWHTTFEQYNAWIEAGGGRGNLRAAEERAVAQRRQEGRQEGRRTGEADEGGGKGRAAGKARRAVKGRLVVHDIREVLAEAEEAVPDHA